MRQEQLPPGATIAPLIISSDKTKLSNFRGDATAWPVYLTIGNLPKEIRRSPSSHGTVLLGYLPVPKFDCFTKSTRSLAKYRLFHDCMSILMESVVKASKKGEDMVCADSWIRQIWPILAAYIADYPEQCLVACCMENRCPICTVIPKERGNHIPQALRTVRETLFFLRRMQSGEDDTAFKTLGLRAIYQPFWANHPHSNIFQAFTPDLLHQLHKGVFKDHLVKWCTEIIGMEEVDLLFRTMPSHPGLRHFQNGISHVSQWTGTEHKEMERVFLGILVASRCGDEQMITAVRALIDFAHYASLQSHTTQTLAGLRKALDDFHASKDIFIKLGGREQDHFNIPKVHSLDHYEELIRLFGSADGFNTESPERLHIDFAKNAYRASNRKDYIQQMTRWLQRQENVDRFTEYLAWTRTPPTVFLSPSLPESPPDSGSPSQPDIEPLGEDAVVIPEHAVSIPQAYSIAKHPPPSSRHVTAASIISSHGYNASQFLEALSTFLSTHGSFYHPHPHDVFSLWKQVVFKLPDIPEVGARHSQNVIRAKPPMVPSRTGCRCPGGSEPGHADFALIRTGEVNAATASSSLKGPSFYMLT
jgi:Plavaka transposase